MAGKGDKKIRVVNKFGRPVTYKYKELAFRPDEIKKAEMLISILNRNKARGAPFALKEDD